MNNKLFRWYYAVHPVRDFLQPGPEYSIKMNVPLGLLYPMLQIYENFSGTYLATLRTELYIQN